MELVLKLYMDETPIEVYKTDVDYFIKTKNTKSMCLSFKDLVTIADGFNQLVNKEIDDNILLHNPDSGFGSQDYNIVLK